MEQSSKIRVFARCKPVPNSEIGHRKCVKQSNEGLIIGEKKFVFDHIFNDCYDQKDIYDQQIKSLIEGCFKGYNATVFACK
jgi:hypothetical protein